MPYTPPFTVYIDGPHHGYNHINYTWCADVSNCSTITSYLWEGSTDGFSYYYLANTSCYTGELPENESLHLKLTVVCVTGETKTAHLAVVNFDTEFCIVPEANHNPENMDLSATRNIEQLEGMKSMVSFEAYPNPSSGMVDISFILPEPATIIFSMFNAKGERLIVKQFKSNVRRNHISLDLSKFDPGDYGVKMRQGKELYSQKIMILK